MSEPYIKVRPHEDKEGLVCITVDQDGFELFMRLIRRAVRLKADNAHRFQAWKDRVEGAFFAAEILMGWKRK